VLENERREFAEYRQIAVFCWAKGGFSGTVAGALQGKVKNVENPGVKSTPWAPEPQGRRR
jgi:hypothetical protein